MQWVACSPGVRDEGAAIRGEGRIRGGGALRRGIPGNAEAGFTQSATSLLQGLRRSPQTRSEPPSNALGQEHTPRPESSTAAKSVSHPRRRRVMRARLWLREGGRQHGFYTQGSGQSPSQSQPRDPRWFVEPPALISRERRRFTVELGWGRIRQVGPCAQ
jgi:hypothetical protein